ncbi:MAG: alpha-L-fucosidase [Verrucomicrobiota bacterium]
MQLRLNVNQTLCGLGASLILLGSTVQVARGVEQTPAPADTIEASKESAAGKVQLMPLTPGPFQPNWESLRNYQCPDWFRDAKFGIFMHWGLPSVADETRPFSTGHYARGMYNQHGQGTAPHCKDIYDWHVARYGHPSKFGYKDLIPLWKAEHFNADALVAFYKSIGARYIVPVAVHHDNFDIYDSSLHRWNVARMGPKRDILGEWKKAAEKHGLRFGASSHLDRAPSFLEASHGSDYEGPLKGVPYDGADPRYRDLYLKDVSQETFERQWYLRTRELIDKYQPDLLYFDGGLPFGDYGLQLAADLYNRNIARHGGSNEAVLNLKRAPVDSAYVLDIERGQSDTLRPLPWQTDTTLISGWFYHKAELEMNAQAVVANLADIVSKNGNLLLNIGLKPDGTIPENQKEALESVGRWLAINGEAIYATRPWRLFGEGPTQVKQGAFNEPKSGFTADDVRFTTKGTTLYAIVLGWPASGSLIIKSLATGREPAEIASVQMLGASSPLAFARDADGLKVRFPEARPCEHAYVLKIATTGKFTAEASAKHAGAAVSQLPRRIAGGK